MRKLLLVEDSLIDQNLVTYAFKEDYQLSIAGNLAEARQFLQATKFDLILLDIMLPDGNGLDFCAELPNYPNAKDTPIILLTAQEDEETKVMGFSLGAEDYVVKPFSKAELRARVDARIKKATSRKSQGTSFVKGVLDFDMMKHRVSFSDSSGDKVLELTPLEFKLLSFLAQNENKVYNRAQIIENVWGKNITVSDRNIDTQISGLRKKLGTKSYYISSVYGEGYKFSTN